MSFSDVSQLLKRAMQRKNFSARVEAAMIIEFFQKIVRERYEARVQRAVRPLYVRDHVLFVSVESPVIAQELKLNEREFVERINDKFGRNEIRELRFLS